MDDSIDAVEVEFMRWHTYWLRHEGDSLGRLLSAKEKHTTDKEIHIDNWSGYYSNK